MGRFRLWSLEGHHVRDLYQNTCGAKGARGVDGGSFRGMGPSIALFQSSALFQNSVNTTPMIVQPIVA